jgi:hypothetical protein
MCPHFLSEELVEPYGQSRWRRTNAQAGRHPGQTPLLPSAGIEGLSLFCPKLLNITRYHRSHRYLFYTLSYAPPVLHSPAGWDLSPHPS